MDRWDIGDPVEIITAISARTEDGQLTPADPDSLALHVVLPDATEAIYAWPEPDVDEGEIEHGGVGDFAVVYVPAQGGVYAYRWLATGDIKGAEPGQFIVRSLYFKVLRPTVGQIAAIRRTRTYVDGADMPAGEEAGTFTDDTRPSASDVESLIDEAVSDICSHFASGLIPEPVWDAARRTVALRVALAIELSDFPENAAEHSPFLQLRADADAAMKTLINVSHTRSLFKE